VREGRLRVIRDEDLVQRWEGNERRKKRAEVRIRRLTSFERFICERTLYLILSFISSQWRDLRIGVICDEI